jgi:competence protein ComEA
MFKKLVAVVLALFAAAAFAATDINKGNQAELEAVKGLGTVTTTKILQERQKGAFKNWADVMQRLHGIKEARAAKLSAAGLTVNGEAFKPGPAPAKLNEKASKGKAGQPKAAANDESSGDPGAAKVARK